MNPTLLPYEAEKATRTRYSSAARAPEPELCCPVEYNPRLLRVIPEEVLSKDYGCGDPSRYLRPGEIVLDLGCGAGKVCFLAAQVVGPTGRVIGVDMTDAMLEVARRNAPWWLNDSDTPTWNFAKVGSRTWPWTWNGSTRPFNSARFEVRTPSSALRNWQSACGSSTR